MKTHCRCRTCRARKALPKQPGEYRNRRICHKCTTPNHYDSPTCDECKANLRLQPKCHNCGDRNWLIDGYRHRVELPQMKAKAGRYRLCPYHCFHHEHRLASTGCQFNFDLTVREPSVESSSLI